ncbi:transmembrane protein 26-like [Saccoglossus kowalevskii]|uniref:Transmembrane protein 26-like n=1 Tax=Saccoglossus kowalevskii TaxID=10224 RepID=A0ABM0GMH7_SACKO|nr:PREDICTED: transmembrane protein 26-like [Saccoglossus kowalevskii]
MEFFGIVKAIITRLMFSVHGFISVWRVTDVKADPLYWLLLMSVLGLLFETIITLKLRKGHEWKWFCPSVLFYLGSVVPSLWILQIELHKEREVWMREAELAAISRGNCTAFSSDAEDHSAESLSEIFKGVTIPGFAFSSENWVLALQQLLLGLLILGRWMLPKGEITRDQLSQLLLVYIGMAADILEFSVETLKEDALQGQWVLTYLILAIWSWSLLQFCLVLTATKSRKPRMARASSESTFLPFVTRCEGGCRLWCESEVWAIMASIVMQDGPFLAMRMFLLIRYDVVNHMMIFFTCKNSLVLVLQVYRLVVLYIEKHPDRHSNSSRRYSDDLTQVGDKSADVPFIVSHGRDSDIGNLGNFSGFHTNYEREPVIEYQTSL